MTGTKSRYVRFHETCSSAHYKLTRYLQDGKESALDVDSYPPLMAASGAPIINVGAVDNTGKNASFSQGGPLVHVMAPGEQVQCAANSFFSSTQKQDGTSFGT